MGNLPDSWRSNWMRDFDRFFETFAMPAALKQANADLAKYTANPSCEVTEDALAYHLKFDLPGIPKDQIKIDLHENRMTVSGERKDEKTADDKRRHFSEVYYGSFARSLTFPTSVNPEKVAANYENGVLSITVPKAEGHRARQITIK